MLGLLGLLVLLIELLKDLSRRLLAKIVYVYLFLFHFIVFVFFAVFVLWEFLNALEAE